MKKLQLISFLVSLCLASCSTPDPLFRSGELMLPNDRILSQFFYPKDPVLSPGDKITISIWGHDDLSIGSVNTTFSSNEATGRWLTLDNDGEANLPKLGRIKLSGLNLKEVNYLLEQRYSDYLNKP
jgi:polysaccharide export outer membrane protein